MKFLCDFVLCDDVSNTWFISTVCVSGGQDETRTNQMVKIEGEIFIMGSDKPIITADGEGPARHVTVDTFWMDVHEVSTAEFKRFVDATGYVTEVSNYCIICVFIYLFLLACKLCSSRYCFWRHLYVCLSTQNLKKYWSDIGVTW